MNRTLLALLLWRRKKINDGPIRKRKCTTRVHTILQQRNTFGVDGLFQELRLDSDRFVNYFRMSSELFQRLLDMTAPHIIKNDSFRDDVISPTQRLALTLRYLASGDSMTSLYYAYRISLTMVSNIIRETTAAIWNALESIVFIKCEENRWCQVAADFDEKWNFPHCLGAIDGKHVVIQAPKNSGSTFFNYKHSHSIVLLGVADANYCFSIVDIGGRGRESDGGIFKKSNFGKALYDNKLSIPADTTLGNDRKLPYVFVGDEAFQLTTFMLRPYPGRGVNAHLDRPKQIFNYRLSRARRIIENAFGILVAKWRIFRRPINCEIDTVINIIKATVCLHNFIIKNNTVEYIQPGLVDAEHNGDLVVGEWRRDVDRSCIQDLPQVGSNSYSKTAAHIRNQFAQYFMEEGAIPWQWDRSHN